MKRVLPVLIVILSACAVSVCAQGFSLRISTPSKQLERAAKFVPVTVTITNNSKSALDTRTLNGITFAFSKCPACLGEMTISTEAKIKAARLKKGRSLSFEVNLAGLHWGGKCCVQTVPLEPNMINVPNDSQLLVAWVSFASRPNSSETIRSNNLEIEIIPKGFY